MTISPPPRKPTVRIYSFVASENGFLAVWAEMMDTVDFQLLYSVRALHVATVAHLAQLSFSMSLNILPLDAQHIPSDHGAAAASDDTSTTILEVERRRTLSDISTSTKRTLLSGPG
ncbi:hypothetical protein EVAR_43298_1 [Eumeta japonica]|uniref:Uncharacterized protein n=1 Tax=Eumeta variegata TaxID=151549 RepID=A0A4C1X1W8_EUMVA|nr:hypothetical protein EVAR_43298_1 [Eumeta japonica]